MTLKCLARGCTHEALPLSNFCTPCREKWANTSRNTYAKLNGKIRATNLLTGIIVVVFALTFLLAFFAMLPKG